MTQLRICNCVDCEQLRATRSGALKQNVLKLRNPEWREWEHQLHRRDQILSMISFNFLYNYSKQQMQQNSKLDTCFQL